jgi:hypothetical protein
MKDRLTSKLPTAKRTIDQHILTGRILIMKDRLTSRLPTARRSTDQLILTKKVRRG